MLKILPNNKIQFINNPPLKQNIINISNITTPLRADFSVIPKPTVSTLIKDFRETVEEENYFKFKTNPSTGKPFTPDVFQNAAAMNLYIGNDVLVTAPTGTGKTAIAEYIITKNLKDNKRTFYTTPLKALSNEKFRDFSKIYGEENVGLLTGDTKINTNAPIVIMTTEVYRNMTASEYFNTDNPSKTLLKDNLGTVIFDELQYLGDIDRGGVWEQSIMFTPKNVQILSLSATIENNTEVNNWIASVKGHKSVCVTPKEKYLPNNSIEKETVLINVPSENRHVPLKFEPVFEPAEIKVPVGRSRKEQIKARREGAVKATTVYAKPAQETYIDITKRLYREDQLPAIYFVFSKKDCKNLLKYLSIEGEELTTREERAEIDSIIKKYKNEGTYLGKSLDINALRKGYAIHNAGLLPSQKKLVEELFQKKLVKVVLATETLSAGINMPARTTVISSPRKPASTSDGANDHKRNLTPNEFNQMAGRAGRRGIDTQGFCYPISCNFAQMNLYLQLINQPSNPILSNLDVDYSFIANYSSEYFNEELLRNILSKSFYACNPNGSLNEEKLNELMNRYNVRKNILSEYHFIDKNGNLTTKGELIKDLNGYEQIPIINLLCDKDFARLDAVQIASIIGGLANIKYNAKDDSSENQSFDEENTCCKYSVDLDYIQAVGKVYSEIKSYEKISDSLYPDRDLTVNGNIIEHIYKWAELNSENENSIENWEDIYESNLKYSIKDEGTLFNEISNTIDLMKQLCIVASNGEKLSSTEYDKEYYRNLQTKLEEGISLLKKEPIVEDSI